MTDVLVYHARDYRDITGDPLYDPNRHTRVQRLYWHARRHAAVRRAGRRRAGRSCGSSRPTRRRAFVRHYEYVAAGGRATCASSPTRSSASCPGLAGDGTESLQSVNFPDRYVRVAGGTVRIDPVEPRPGVRRAGQLPPDPASSGGVSLQVATDRGDYLQHDRGALTVGGTAGRRSSTFTLT